MALSYEKGWNEANLVNITWVENLLMLLSYENPLN